MPVIPEFQPAAPSGRGFAQSMTLMQQASANRRAEESQEMERQKFEIMRPVLESQARVQLVSEANDLTAAHIVNNSMVTDLLRFPDYVKAWTESATLEDPKERLNERRRILGAITPFAAIKSTAPMVKAFQEQYAQDANADKTADVLAGRLEVSGAQNEAKAAKTQADNETKLAVKQKDLEVQQARLEAAQQKFEQQQAHAKEIAQMRKETIERGQDMTAETKRTQAEALGKRPKEAAARKYNETEVVSRVRPSTEELPKFMRALDLLDSPEVRTGTAAGIETAARRFGEIFGFQPGKAASLEELNSTLGSSFLNYVGQMKGAISDKETAALISMSPGVGKTAEGNIALVNNIVRALNRNIALGDLVQRGRDADETEAEIQSGVLRTMIDTPMESFAPVRATSALTPDEQKRLQELRAKRGR